MTAEELYEAGCTHRSRALENTQYTHVHSVDIEDGVFKNYFLPAAQDGYPPAIAEVVEYYIKRGERTNAYSWLKEYKRITGCKRRDIVMRFGSTILASSFHL